MNKDTSGPAFPTSNGGSPDDGMTLRDFFAASIIAGLYASHGGNPPEPEQMAEDAYEIASAMLEARHK